MMLRRLLKHRGLGINLIAGFSFLMLAVYGWGLDWKDLGGYLFIIFIFLVGLIGLAALLGWLLRKWMSRGEKNHPTTKMGTKGDTQNRDNDNQDEKGD